MIYRGYKIELNEWGYYEAESLEDCDSSFLYAKTLEEIKIEIDEIER